MGVTVYDTADLPPEHRFEWWRETVSNGAGPTRLTTDRPADFNGSMSVVSLGATRLAVLDFPPLLSERTARLIRQSDPETYEMTLLLSGGMNVSQSRQDARLRAGDFNLWTSSRPYVGRGTSDGDDPGPSRAVVLHLPRADLLLPEARTDRLIARALPSATGIGAVLAHHLVSVVQEAAFLAEGDGERLGDVTRDLATAFLAHCASATDRLTPESRRRLLLRRLDLFIEDNLSDPGLSPPAIAARHHISVRLLHKLFAERKEAVAETIRRRRLERCSADLLDPTLSALPIHAVASRWGFTDAAIFSRAFRNAYGLSPREHRHRHGVRLRTC
ncbi:helix-turn-helix domain-containing protein [Streptomyces sp. NPDC059917]|uniref:AraC-like ligand-binding domain-containing protein n=1 Tax=Streptomyces sp. NPDC059917 TaxID=3347002 RepID=UPI0036671F6B